VSLLKRPKYPGPRVARVAVEVPLVIMYPSSDAGTVILGASGLRVSPVPINTLVNA
jgi:hypothetical protein